MPTQPKAGQGGWSLGRRAPPGLKELTIELGDSDVYINTAKRIDLDNGHVLYEAILTDPSGSRAIYIDREEVVECLKEAFLASAAGESAGAGPGPERPS